jgi:hypothetical protein
MVSGEACCRIDQACSTKARRRDTTTQQKAKNKKQTAKATRALQAMAIERGGNPAHLEGIK